MTKKNNKKNKIFILVFRIVSLIIILICLYSLYKWNLENKQNNNLISDIKSQIILPDITSIANENSPEISSDVSPENSQNNSTVSLVDFSNLLSINSDTIAWIKINNTNVDFPVVKTQDNEYYLKHNFNKQYNSAGWIYADYRNKFDNTDKNIIIYGHNRRDGSMFSSLKNTLSESWYTNPDNLQIPLYTTSGNYIYQIFSIYAILAQNFNNSVEFSSDEDFQNYINDALSKSIYNFNVDVSSNDNILTLYTCGNNTKYRVIIHAKKITN